MQIYPNMNLFKKWTAEDEKLIQEEREQWSKKSKEEWAAAYAVDKEDTTCFYCPDNATCPCAWDIYNTDGDCLMDK